MNVKPILFRVLAVALPFGLLLVVEAGLRLAGAGAAPAFVPLAGQPGYQTFNPVYGQRYFRGFAPSVAFHPFREEKPKGAFRVFVLGGSSAAGFPYHFPYAFPDRLAARLEEALPGRTVEVVNLGMTAVNSYTLWDLGKAVVAQRPDAVLIYAGHNEYYGAFGVGSTIQTVGDRGWLKRLVLRLKHTALYTTLEALLAPPPEGPPAESRTLMARVVRDAAIMRGGAVYMAGLEQFEANMAAMLEHFRAADIPVYLATLTANLADQPPLGEDTEALVAYQQGQQLLAEGDTLAARVAFAEAKELDVIRFRAPEAINDAIRRLAEAPGVTLVDVAEVFRRHSPQQIEGAALFDDHLHPNARGYDLMATAFYEALRGHPRLLNLPEIAHTERAVDPVEQAYAALQIDRLKTGYPFDKVATPEEAARTFEQRLAARLRGSVYDSLAARVATFQKPPQEALYEGVLHARRRADTLAALQLYAGLLPWQPFNEALMEEAVSYAVEQPQYDAAVAPIARFAAHRTGALDFINTLAAIRLRQGQLGRAGTWLAAAEAHDSTTAVTLYNTARLHLLRGDTLAAKRYFARYQQYR